MGYSIKRLPNESTSLTQTDKVVVFDSSEGEERNCTLETLADFISSAGAGLENVSLLNPTAEDTDGGRESAVIHKGTQSGGEETTLAKAEASHDGASDDEKGKYVISTNDGSDGDTPTARLTIDSNGLVEAAGEIRSATLSIDDLGGTNYDIQISDDKSVATAGNGGAGLPQGSRVIANPEATTDGIIDEFYGYPVIWQWEGTDVTTQFEDKVDGDEVSSSTVSATTYNGFEVVQISTTAAGAVTDWGHAATILPITVTPKSPNYGVYCEMRRTTPSATNEIHSGIWLRQSSYTDGYISRYDSLGDLQLKAEKIVSGTISALATGGHPYHVGVNNAATWFQNCAYMKGRTLNHGAVGNAVGHVDGANSVSAVNAPAIFVANSTASETTVIQFTNIKVFLV